MPDFRRLCIFKGIYPREPRSKKRAFKSSTPSTTFYYTRDIQYLLHEPLLAKFRDHKALAKKIARSLGRGEVGDAARLEKHATPRLALDHIIKERYPTFVDALRDLDDALTMLHLFAHLPSTSTVPSSTIALCQRLCLEFQHYVITTHCLRKSFISIKGIYYQATINGQDIMWMVPHKFVQRVTGDVDFRIMGTFVEFYTTLLNFVNFRLYNSIGLIYPPKFNFQSDEGGAELAAFSLEGNALGGQKVSGDVEQLLIESSTSLSNELQQKVAAISEATIEQENEDFPKENMDRFEAVAPDSDPLLQPSSSTIEAASLFANITVYLSRETPRAPLEFLLRAFGCRRIGWPRICGDGAYVSDEAEAAITHQVVDRPLMPGETSSAGQSQMRMPGRIYIQPQWVWDCVNEGKLLRTDLYAQGATLPPHLSPWVKPSKGQYDPKLSLVEQEDEGEAQEADEAGPFEGFDDVPEHSHQDDLEMEAAGVKFDPAKPIKAQVTGDRKKRQRREAEELERRKMMLSRKKRKLLDKMTFSNDSRDREAEKLRAKRRSHEAKRQPPVS